MPQLGGPFELLASVGPKGCQETSGMPKKRRREALGGPQRHLRGASEVLQQSLEDASGALKVPQKRLRGA